jgi:hypothetical protein
MMASSNPRDAAISGEKKRFLESLGMLSSFL